MKQLQHVIWSKGVFLTPQHLQVQDRYIEDSLQFQLEALSFRLWGFAKLQIDEGKLLEGQFSILAARGIFPDGLLFDFPAVDGAPSSRAVNDCFTEERPRVAVYLSVPEQRDGGVNVSARLDTKTRFQAELRLLRDENSGLQEKPVQIARKNLRLLLEGENHEGSTVMQVAVVEKTQAGTYRLAPGFVPPTIDVHGNDLLLGMVRGLMETLAAKGAQLSGARRQKNQSLADFTVSDVANFWLLYTINSHLPIFRHLFHRDVVHPEQLFTAMISLAGALTTFSILIHPRDLPEYRHDDLGTCFLDLEQKIRTLLDTVVAANFVSLPLKVVRPSIHATAIEDDQYLRNTRLYLAVSADMKDVDLITRAPQLMKVGGASYVDDIVKQAMPGLKMSYVPSPPSEIPVKLKSKYFSLDTAGPVWEGIQRARNLGVYAPAEFANLHLELVILLPRKE